MCVSLAYFLWNRLLSYLSVFGFQANTFIIIDEDFFLVLWYEKKNAKWVTYLFYTLI